MRIYVDNRLEEGKWLEKHPFRCFREAFIYQWNMKGMSRSCVDGMVDPNCEDSRLVVLRNVDCMNIGLKDGK